MIRTDAWPVNEASAARRRARALAAGAWLMLVLITLAPRAAWAHAAPTIGQSKIRQVGEVVRYDLAVNYDELATRVATPAPRVAPGREPTDAQREAALRQGQEDLGAYVGARVRVFLDGVECEDTLDGVQVERFEGEVFALMSLAYRCPGSASGSFEVHYDLFLDDAASAPHANVADYELGGSSGRVVFERGEQRLVAGRTSLLSSAGHFVALGFEHILGGMDHVLFIMALLLGAGSVTAMLKVATAFTAAHSVTLALAAMGWVSVPPGIVEPLIALSIAYVAVENIRGASRNRLVVVFGFGLMHGLGFAGTLSFTDQVSWRLISSLFTFNLGIELGQALIIVVAFPLVLLVRRFRWSTWAQVGASGLIGGLGFVWLFERLFLA